MPLGLTTARHMNHFRDLKTNLKCGYQASQPASWERDDRRVLFANPNLFLCTHADSSEH